MNIIHEGNYHVIVSNWSNSEERGQGKIEMEQKGYQVYKEYLDNENMKVNVVFIKIIHKLTEV